MSHYRLTLLLSLPLIAVALQCYNGTTYVKGQSIGTDKETCSSSNDYCYNITADATDLTRITHAGCSSTRCFIARNKCIEQNYFGKKVRFCCCNNGDLCNSRSTNATLLERGKNRIKDFFSGLG